MSYVDLLGWPSSREWRQRRRRGRPAEHHRSPAPADRAAHQPLDVAELGSLLRSAEAGRLALATPCTARPLRCNV